MSEATVRIKMKCGRRGPEGWFRRGQEVEVSADVAEQLVREGSATVVRPVKRAVAKEPQPAADTPKAAEPSAPTEPRPKRRPVLAGE